jgi:Na+-transporting methylmalonyl-CoA/oxaloacetate decarboxylase gamma subunit
MRRRVRRGAAVAEHPIEEGPFVSFTDLFIGILFLFLILVAALMLMHQQAIREAQEAARQAEAEAQRLREEIARIQAELDEFLELNIDHPPYRLAIVFNSYQRPADSGEPWRFTRTVQLFKTTEGLCVENIVLRNNLNLGWKPPVTADDIPEPGRQDLRGGTPCTLSALGESWDDETETGGVRRVAPDLYSGSTVLHSPNGEQTIELEYRVLGVYLDEYRSAGVPRGPFTDSEAPAPPTRTFELN